MEPGDGFIHCTEILRLIRGRYAWKGAVPKDSPVNTLHDIEPRSDDRLVVTQSAWTRNGKSSRVKRRNDPIFAVNGMRRAQQLAWWLASQHVTTTRGVHFVGGIRLSALELKDGKRSLKFLDFAVHPISQAYFIKPMAFLDFACSRKLLLSAGHIAPSEGWCATCRIMPEAFSAIMMVGRVGIAALWSSLNNRLVNQISY